MADMGGKPRLPWVSWLIAAAVACIPLVITDRFLIKVLTFVGLNVLVAIGLALLFGYTGQVSMGHAAFVGIGAYTCAFLTVRIGTPWIVGFAAAGVIAAAGGLLLALPSLRLKGHYLAMATLGFGEIMSLIFVEAESVTGGVDGFARIPPPSVAGFEFKEPATLYWLVWAVAGVALLLAYNITRFRPGRAMLSLHGGEIGAVASGVDVVGTKIKAFVISAALAGLSGALYSGVVGFVSPSVFVLSSSVMYLAMAVIGGAGSLAGPVAATALFTLLEYLNALIPSMPAPIAENLGLYQTDIYGIAIILVVIFAPRGLTGLWQRRRSASSAKGGSLAERRQGSSTQADTPARPEGLEEGEGT